MFKAGRLVALMLVVGTGAAQAGHPYEQIAEKNAFGLKAAPVIEPKIVPVPVAPPSDVTLTGMASVAGKKQVFLKMVVPGEKDAKYLRLGELERDGGIEVLEIDLKNERVRLKHNGQPMVMTFATHGAKAGSTPVAAKLPPVPVMVDMKQVRP